MNIPIYRIIPVFLVLLLNGLAHAATGNAGADEVVSEINNMTPVVTSIIQASLALAFVYFGSIIAWKIFRKLMDQDQDG